MVSFYSDKATTAPETAFSRAAQPRPESGEKSTEAFPHVGTTQLAAENLDLAGPSRGTCPRSSLGDAENVTEGEEVPPGGWEGQVIVGEEIIHGEWYYMVVWKPTLEPEGNLANMRELVAKWKAKVQASGQNREQSGVKKPGTSGKKGGEDRDRSRAFGRAGAHGSCNLRVIAAYASLNVGGQEYKGWHCWHLFTLRMRFFDLRNVEADSEGPRKGPVSSRCII
ncbi:hypothetical protein B0T24DRAFT_598427 [Lasiosphaeria ovina]|uniref:Chromo domain-containing protein n=1 Tax=Lasiosphaeria ovina TaxID=92902 RepID=A0AAE0JVL2_9PEZI|nr:hypothetical protein B0T24DRAFT_598427 [Lasiosphaeria ovina]